MNALPRRGRGLTRRSLATAALAAVAAAGLAGCGDSAPADDRAEAAVALCRDHGGATALEDNIVICRDQTYHDTQ
jgi:hypothetical protein